MIPITFKNSVEIIRYIQSRYNKTVYDRTSPINFWHYKVYITENISLHCDGADKWLGGSPDMYTTLSDLQHNVGIMIDGLHVFSILSNRFLLDKFIKYVLKENKNCKK